MTTTATEIAGGTARGGWLREGLAGLWSGYMAWRRHQAMLRIMHGMTDLQLADVFGIRRDQIEVTAARVALDAAH